MEFSKPKEKLRHYKSLDSLCSISKENNIDKKNIRHFNNTSANNRQKTKCPQSRLTTENHQKIIVNAEQLKRNHQASKNKQKLIDSKKNKHNIPVKTQIIRTNSYKKIDKIKPFSPVTHKFTYKKQNNQADSTIKITKKGKDKKIKMQFKQTNATKGSQSHLKQTQSVFIEPRVHKSKKKSKQQISRQKSAKKLKKFRTEMSQETTPSCLVGDQVDLLDLIGHGTFGQVFRGRIRKTGQIIAIKRVIQDSRYKNRQIEIIKMIKNDFIVQMMGSYITQEGIQECLNIKMKYYDQNLYQRIKFYKQSKLNKLEIKIILYQLFKGLSYLHSIKICHRDIKPQNILLRGCQTVICDFGSAKILNNLQSNISYICARCYRAPQLIFGSNKYTTIVDIWSAGCVILQILNGQPLFIGQTSINHLLQIIKIMGTPTEQEVINMNPQYNIKEYRFPKFIKRQWQTIFPEADESLLSLLKRIMVYSPNKRLKAIQVLSHEYFDQIRDQFTYYHIKSQFNLKHFFQFSHQELESHLHLKDKLMPSWLNQH